MSIFAWIMIGLIAGWLAAKVTESPHGLIRNLVVGLIGSLIGGVLFTRLGVHVVPDFWGQLITAIVGAVLLLFLLQVIRRA
ncbi:MAG: GlsB/YeaQ/YmgE family stress response membrane protein [Bradyrhizobiaceae bacterium]|nr:GlsB/YeaQ/YmgE family stress response membrane protein [Bradyrhizobiaceae bacterium]